MNDVKILRELASKYAIIANSDINRERIILHKNVNDLKQTRPIVLIDEIPWAQMNINDELTLRCEDEYLRGIENYFRTTLYKWNHMPADMVVTPYVAVKKVINSTGIGVSKIFDDAEARGDSVAKAHQFINQFETEEDVDKLHNQVITYDEVKTKERFNLLGNIIGDIVPVKIVGEATGYGLGCKTWDDIVELRGLDTLLYDLIDYPELMHKLAGKLTDIFIDKVRQYDELGLFDGDSYYLHSTSALTNDLNPDQSHVRANQVWGRGLAQIFASVSPDMHDEFDITYMKKAMEPFGLVYYGCCEPLHNKIHILEKIPNLRKISITPWADVDVAAEIIGKKYVVGSKPNPSNLATPTLDKEHIRKEVTKILDACHRNSCACEIVLKDITSVCGRPQNLFEWEQVAMDVVRNY